MTTVDDIQTMIEAATKQVETPTNTIDVTIKGKQSNSDGRPYRSRTIHITLRGKWAQDFLQHPTLELLWTVYGVDLGDGVMDDQEQSIMIESITAQARA